MRIAVLAVQGAFVEHEAILKKLNIDCFEIRQKSDLEKPFDGLIIPGGESTAIGKLLKELDLMDSIREKIIAGLPVLGTCAGLILLADKLSNDNKTHLATLPVTVKRNAYGRQLGSFTCEADFKGIGNIQMVFIRAPYIEDVRDNAEILASVNQNIAAVRYKNQLGVSFHPELTKDYSIHSYFIDMVNEYICLK